jgi:hypothetical protein
MKKLLKRGLQPPASSSSSQSTNATISCGGGGRHRRLTKQLIKGSLVTLVVVYLILMQSAHRVVRKDERIGVPTTHALTAATAIDHFGFFQQQPAGTSQSSSSNNNDHSFFADAFPIIHGLVLGFKATIGMIDHRDSDSAAAAASSVQQIKNDSHKTSPSYDHTIYRRFDENPAVGASSSNATNIWTKSNKIPGWMKEYFDWHHDQRQQHLNKEQWTQLRFMVIQCLDEFKKCGGTSDRLKPLPSLIRTAARSKRLLFIYWNRPCALEEFLLPPAGGLDWRVPDWLADELNHEGPLLLGDHYKRGALQDTRTVRVQYQSYDGGAGWYDELLERDKGTNTTIEASFDDVYHDVWEAVFTPSPPIASAIVKEMKNNGLRPGHYVSAHLRLLYFKSFRQKRMIEKFTRNGINCSSTLRPGGPFFLASDASYATEYGPLYGQEMNVSVVVHKPNPDPPLHLDRPDGVVPTTPTTTDRPPSDFYDTFIDLYLLAMGGCNFVSKGGFGLWAALIGGENMKCLFKERLKHAVPENPCDFQPVNGTSSIALDGTKKTATDGLQRSPFLEPMA